MVSIKLVDGDKRLTKDIKIQFKYDLGKDMTVQEIKSNIPDKLAGAQMIILYFTGNKKYKGFDPPQKTKWQK